MNNMTEDQLERFSRDGYLVLKDVLDPLRDLAPVLAEWQHTLDGIAEMLFSMGQVASTYRELAFGARLIALTRDSGQTFVRHFDPSLPERNLDVAPAIGNGPAIFGLLRNDEILDIVGSLIGPEIYSNPVQHIRMKYPSSVLGDRIPRNGLTHVTLWHQDNGVVLPEADDTQMVTVWIPMTRANVANGCLTVIPGSHLRGLVDHCPGEIGLGLSDRALGEAERIAVPMEPGSLLLMHKHMMHASLDNGTQDEVRISLDLRYQPIGQSTGRPDFPGFVARSATNPASELRDPIAWANSWYATRRDAAINATKQLTFHRWDGDSELCA